MAGDPVDVQQLAESQAALRRIAAVAAAGSPPETVFDTVTSEASVLLGGALVALTRFEGNGSGAVVVARTGGHVAVGTRLPVTGETTLARLWRTGRTERMDSYVDGPGTNLIQQLGIRAGVSVPVTVDGALWGALGLSSRTGPLPADTEHRLTAFVEIVAAAAASAEARESARVLAAEQTALLRVAALVARGAGAVEVFDAVAEEAAGLIDDEATTLVRYEGDRTFLVLAHRHGPAPVGMRFTVPTDDAGTLDQMMRTLKPARLDRYDAIADRSFSKQNFGVGSSVSVPVVVDGRLWGALGTLNEGRRLPVETERRLGSSPSWSPRPWPAPSSSASAPSRPPGAGSPNWSRVMLRSARSSRPSRRRRRTSWTRRRPTSSATTPTGSPRSSPCAAARHPSGHGSRPTRRVCATPAARCGSRGWPGRRGTMRRSAPG